MLAKHNRLTRSEIELLFSGAEVSKKHSGHFNCLSLSGPIQASKFAVSVSKKNYPRRVDRNRIRRFIYDVIRLNQDRVLPQRALVIVKDNVLEKLHTSPEKIRSELLELLM